jgi:7-carboxy-7-deazaguanine synthase
VALRVNEIFYGIQGESSHAGRPCVFIRLTGCNLRCSWCDTPYAYEEGTDMDMETVLKSIEGYGCPLTEVTGGEPLVQKETPELIRRLLEKDYTVLLETNGSLDVSAVDRRCVKILDIKCPSSGESDRNDLRNLERLTERDEIKFVIANREDYDFARNILRLIGEMPPGANIVHFSPLFGRMEPQVLAAWMLEDRLPARLQLQIHKILWPAERRGV